ncbi:hypothetical protein COP2_008284 [Malus domestica]
MEQFPPIAAWSAILAYMSRTAQKATDRDELSDKGYDGDAGQVCWLEMVADGSLTVFFQGKQGLVLLHRIQLHRHAMQIIGRLLINDNRSTARYIRRNHLTLVVSG